MNKIKKYKWIIAITCAILIALGVWLVIRATTRDAMFYQVKCLYSAEDTYYSLIVDDKKSARAFKREMSRSDLDGASPDSCEMIYYDRATDDTLFVYSVMTVLKDVMFAFSEHHIGKNYSQIQFFNAGDEIVSLSCQYSDARFNCFDKMPDDPTCPDTSAAAMVKLSSICDYKPVN